jgi:hypothetical protein
MTKARDLENGLDLNYLREILSYNSETGEFVWMKRTSRNTHVGDVAGCVWKTGYRIIAIGKNRYMAHRIAWFMFYGSWPKITIDHIDGNKLNNRIANLRDATYSMNSQNRKSATMLSKTGVLGVVESNGKFRVHLGVNGKVLYFGAHETKEKAHSVYLEAKRRLHPGCTI